MNHKIMKDALSRSDLMLANELPITSKRSLLHLPFDRINWIISSFLIGTLTLTLTAVPLYVWFFGLDWFQIVLFFAMLVA